jgi:hypothetical protein
MKLKGLRRDIQQEIQLLFDNADDLEPMEFMNSIHQINLIARFATIALYRAREAKEREFQLYISQRDNVCVIVGEPPTMQAATKKFLDGLALGSSNPLNLKNVRSSGIEGVDWIHLAIKLMIRFREFTAQSPPEVELEHPIFHLSGTDSKLKDEILALPELSKQTVNVWAKCMTGLYLRSPEAKCFPDIHQEIKDKSMPYAEDKFNERQVKRERKLYEDFPEDKMKDFAFDVIELPKPGHVIG